MCRVNEIDNMQRATLAPLKENSLPLKSKVPYDQLRPYKTSELHDIPEADEDIDDSNDEIIESGEISLQAKDESTIPASSEEQSVTSENDCTVSPQPTNEYPPPTSSNGCEKPSESERKKRLPKKQILHSQPNSNPNNLVVRILEKDYWLNDEDIDHVQSLISKQYPQTNGLHSVLAFEPKKPKVEAGLKNFVQVMNFGNNHWVTVTNISCESNRIKVYDSLYSELSEKERQKFYASLASLINTNEANMIIEWPSMEQQNGSSDCGLFALAVAVCLSEGENPSEHLFDQTVMREHLALCIQCDELAAFPVKSFRTVKDRIERSVDLFCHCRKPYRKGVFMIECSKCLDWFHRSCETVPKTVYKNTSFYCKNCK